MATYLDGVQYAQDVVDGKILNCKYIIQACQRFLDDLEREDWKWKFNVEKANHALLFVEHSIVHVKGPLAGEAIKLEPWQVFILVNLFGWFDDDEVRRFNYAVLEIPRKNGKSIFASALAIYEMAFGQEGAEVYSLATKRDQAKICWDVAARMLERGPKALKKRFKTTQSKIVNYENWSTYTPLGRDSKSHDGLNPSLSIFDEAAAYSDPHIVSVMESATGARWGNFLHLFITTAQYSKTTIYYDKRSYLVNLLDGKYEDDRFFGVIYTLDEGDDWQDESVWPKANPNFNVSIDPETLRGEVKQAKELLSKRSEVIVKHFNVWQNTADAWIDTAFWTDEINVLDEINRSGKLFVGLDLAMTTDLCAVTSLYVAGDVYHADFKCFLPEEALKNATASVLPIYQRAVDRGSLIVTEGDVTDYNFIQQYIEQLAEENNLEAVAYDPYNSTQLVTNLTESKINLLKVGQSIGHLSPAAKQTEAFIISGLIKHLNDPFILWQLENCTVYRDLNENIKVRKGDDNTLKIDAIIALIMAVSLAAGHLELKKKPMIWTVEE